MYTSGAYLFLSILFSIIIAFFAAKLIYQWPWQKENNKTKSKFNKWLFLLRIIAITTILLVLFNPGIEFRKINIEKPILVILKDNSQSVKALADSIEIKKIDSLLSKQTEKLKKTYTIKTRFFSDKSYKSYTKKYNGKVTDISNALRNLNIANNEVIAGTILVSDGNYNRGENPVFTAKKLPFPIYSVRIGDTLPQTNLYIHNFLHNEIGYLNEKTPVEIDLRYLNIKKDTTIKLKITRNNKVLGFKNIIVKEGSNADKLMLYFIPKQEGLQDFKLQIEGITKSVRKFYMRINQQKQKILVLYHAVHPDLGAIRKALNKSNRFEPLLTQANDFDGNFSGYSAVILHQIPSGVFSEDRWFAQVIKLKIPYWLILGPNTDYVTFNQADANLEITSRTGEFEQISGVLNNNFESFKIEPSFQELIATWPPLTVSFGQYKLKKANILLNQAIHDVKTDRPAWIFVDQPYRYSILAGTGIWKWSMYNYKQTDNHYAINDLIYKTIKYISLNKPKKRLVVTKKELYGASQPIKIEAVLYNKNFETDNSAPGSLVLTDSSQQKYKYMFNPLGNKYTAEIGIMPAGKYTFKAQFKTNQEVFNDTGSFMVDYANIEQNSKLSNSLIMRQIASVSRSFDLSNIENLSNSILNESKVKSVRKIETHISDLIDEKFFMFFIVLFLAAEWLIRKYNGKI